MGNARLEVSCNGQIISEPVIFKYKQQHQLMPAAPSYLDAAASNILSQSDNSATNNYLDIFDDNGDDLLLLAAVGGSAEEDNSHGGQGTVSNNLLLEDLERVMKYTLLQKLEKLCDKMETLAENMAGNTSSKTKVQQQQS